jgi:hypothetical protein
MRSIEGESKKGVRSSQTEIIRGSSPTVREGSSPSGKHEWLSYLRTVGLMWRLQQAILTDSRDSAASRASFLKGAPRKIHENEKANNKDKFKQSSSLPRKYGWQILVGRENGSS